MNQPLIDAHIQEEDGIDASIRPQKLGEFTGQPEVRENLGIFISAARARHEPLDHVLFYGPPGLGKTTLAHIVAREMGVGIRPTAGPILTKPGDLAAILTSLQPNDVLFIDEIHRLPASVEEMLYTAMEDFKLDVVIGEGPAARSIRIELTPFTLVGATTRLGLISSPLRDRFGIPLRLRFYSPEELQKVLLRASDRWKCPMDAGGASEIARRSRGTPRIALRLLRRVRDFAQAQHHATITQPIADASLTRLEVDHLGLDSADRRYLQYIAQHYQGGPVGIETLSAGLSEQRDAIEETIEPYLLQIGLLQRTPRGRMLSPGGFSHLNLLPPSRLREEWAQLPLSAPAAEDPDAA